MNHVTEARHIIKNFQEFRAVSDISFEFVRGETFAILGENGAGKLTTVRMFACLSPLNSGKLLVENFDVNKDERKIRSVNGIVPQENILAPDLNVRENLIVYSRYFRIPKAEAERRSNELLDFIRLKDKAGKRKNTRLKTRFGSNSFRRRARRINVADETLRFTADGFETF